MENVRYSVYSTVVRNMAHAGKWEAMNDRSSVPSSLGRTEISDDWQRADSATILAPISPRVSITFWGFGSALSAEAYPGDDVIQD